MPCRARLRANVLARTVLALVGIALTGNFEAPVRAAVSLSAVAPLGASAGVVVQITGTGFDATAGNNTVTLTLPGGASASLTGETIAVVDAAKGIRRVGVTVPAGLPTGNAAVVVTNRITAESAGGRSLQIVSMALPEITGGPRGAQQLAVRITGSANTQFVAGRTTVTFGAGITVAAVQVSSPTALVASLNISANAALGPRAVTVVTSTQTLALPAAFAVIDPNRAPAFTSSPLLTAQVGQAYSYLATAADPDNDPIAFRRVSGPTGLQVGSTGLVSWTPGAADPGDRDVAIEAADGRGGTALQAFRIAVAAPPQIVALEVTPLTTRLSAAGETRQLTVTGRRSDGQTIDLSSASSGTTYESSNRFVATASPDGMVAAVANGDTTVTARNGSLSATSAVAVEIGVTLQSLQLDPSATTLRAAGATVQLVLRGSFSDGSSRDLTGAPGTTFVSGSVATAMVGADGLVTANATGQTTITARHDGREATASVTVNISGGGGFLRGEAYDDARGLPLAGAVVTVVSDGGGTPAAPVSTVADDRGRFTLAGRAGAAIVRIARPGYTAVERQGVIPLDGAATILDARLTPLDGHVNAIGSALGGTATDSAQRAVLRIGPGGLPADASVTLTPLGPQGLEGVLPRGWSPIAAVGIEPGGVTFGFPLSLTLTHSLGAAPAGTAATLVRYDRSTHQWMSLAAVTLDAGGLSFTGIIDRSGTFAVVVPDAPPLAPPVTMAGQPLAGFDQGSGAANMTAAGDVMPRSAPPGDNVRATGRFALSAAMPIASGTIVQVHVSERFDLLDATEIHTLPFTQDLIAYATPRPSIGGLAGAAFPITPSRTFSIQELMLGVIRLDVQSGGSENPGTVLGSSGGTVTNEDGDVAHRSGRGARCARRSGYSPDDGRRYRRGGAARLYGSHRAAD